MQWCGCVAWTHSQPDELVLIYILKNNNNNKKDFKHVVCSCFNWPYTEMEFHSGSIRRYPPPSSSYVKNCVSCWLLWSIILCCLDDFSLYASASRDLQVQQKWTPPPPHSSVIKYRPPPSSHRKNCISCWLS